MAENVDMRSLRRYEVSIWTIQDRFLSILKWFDLEQKGQIQEPSIILKDDGTQEFSFSIPKFYYVGDTKILNPVWHQINETPLEANMHKLKVIFNKNIGKQYIDDLDSFIVKLNLLILDLFDLPLNFTVEQFQNKTINEALVLIEAILGDNYNEDKMRRLKRQLNLEEVILEFLVISVTEDHAGDNVSIEVKSEGLAFHELGKIGYKISLEPQNFIDDYNAWFEYEFEVLDAPEEDIHYWNKKIFGPDDQHLYTNWTYKVDMDWSAHSSAHNRSSNQVYEDEYVSSWNTGDGTLSAKYVEGARVKWRSIEVKESNIYNITQTIAKTFGVFCRYEYGYNENYQIVSRTVIYYNNYIQDKQGHLDLTYPYTSTSVTRLIDASNITTKLFVRSVDDTSNGSETLTIMDVEANKSKEDYILNFDYLYKIGTITQEQYDEIAPYEYRLRIANDSLYHINEHISALQRELTELEAKKATLENSIVLDDEQYTEAIDAQSALTNDEGSIEHFKSHPIIQKSDRENYYYIATDSLKGLLEDSIHIYRTMNYQTQVPENEITNNIQPYRNDVNQITSIGFPFTGEISSIVYLKCRYNPKTYYEQVSKLWASRKDNDQTELQRTKDRIEQINIMLYGNEADWAKADLSKTDLGDYWAGIACDDDELGVYHIEMRQYITSYVGESRTYSNENSTTAIALNDLSADEIKMTEFNEGLDTPNLYSNEAYYLNKKREYINEFNKMMGPALREGYWQPEDYNDYGDRYEDGFLIWPSQYGSTSSQSTSAENIPDPNGHVSFIWDWEKLYENETEFIFTSSIDNKQESYVAIKLNSSMIDLIKDHLDNLSFFYYDLAVIQTLYEIEHEGNASASQTTAWINSLKENMLRSFTLGASCELGWLQEFNALATTPNNNQVIPVLILTGAKSLDTNTLKYISTGKFTYTKTVGDAINGITTQTQEVTSSYQPFIGYYEPVKDENEKIIGQTAVNLTNINFTSDIIYEDDIEPIVVAGEPRAYNFTEYTYRRVYPRIYFDTLKLKNYSDELHIKLNYLNLENNTDYYVVEDDRTNGLDDSIAGYYVTLRPEQLFKIGRVAARIDLVYTLSNADTAIYLDAIKVSKENAYPKVSYEVQLSILNPKLVRSAYNLLNQIVQINDVDLQLEDVNGYISSVTIALDKPWEDQVEIKNYETKFEDLFSTIVAQTEAMKKSENGLQTAISAFSSYGKIDPTVLSDSIRSADLNYQFNQGKLTISEKDGIWALSDSGVVAMRGGGIFTATDRDETGNWIWNTGIIPSGINANLITSGQLDTNLIRIYSGDDLRFQWNGEGLYAYKSVLSETGANDTNNIIPVDNIDKKQYVLYNSEGLFLRTEAGAIISDGTSYSLQSLIDINNVAVEQIDRVEISWRGLILRNWRNEEVFYADPDTGNLTLSGTIIASSGTIGGWAIGSNQLSAAGIALLSGNNAGIQLTNLQDIQDREVDTSGNIYYKYSTTKGGTTYYYKQEGSLVPISGNNLGTVYTKTSKIIQVVPKYIKAEEVSAQNNENQSSSGDTVEYTNSLTVSVVYYIMENSARTIYATDVASNKITYDNDTSPTTASWYLLLKNKSNYKNYINEIVEDQYTIVSSNLPTILYPSGVTGVNKFSVEATTGTATILQGTLGNFSFDTSGLTGGILTGSKIDKSNKIIDNSHTFGEVFYDFTGDSNTGNLTLKRVNGSEVNFNIAATQFYKNAIAAAGAITLTITSSDGTLIATATSG